MSSVVNAISSVTNGVATALTPQNGYNASSPVNVDALNGQVAQSQGNLQQNYQNQNALATQLQQQALGQGPNPAQALLQQGTNNAIQQNAGFLASQKGINPALAARLGAQNAASMSQQAAGQGATLSAEQQLGAQSNLANLYGTTGNQQLQNIATSGSLANQGGLGAQQINAGVAAQNAAANQNTAGGLLNAGGAALGLAMAKGGMVPQNYAGGGGVNKDPLSGNVWSYQGPDGTNWQTQPADASTAQQPAQQDQQPMFAPSNASSDIANKILASAGVNVMPAGNQSLVTGTGPQKALQGLVNLGAPAPAAAGGGTTGGGIGAIGETLSASPYAKGGKVLPMHLHHVASIYHGAPMPDLKAAGGKVPGQAKVQGDSLKNDVVSAKLSPGELVIPRSVMNSKDPVKAGSEFIAKELSKSGKYAGQDKNEFQAALKQAMVARR